MPCHMMVHCLQVDGLSNQFWGWGREDDELHMRLKEAGLKVCDGEEGWRWFGMGREGRGRRCRNKVDVGRMIKEGHGK